MSVGREYGGEKNLPRGRFIFPIEGPCSETAEYDSTTAYFCMLNGRFCRSIAGANSTDPTLRHAFASVPFPGQLDYSKSTPSALSRSRDGLATSKTFLMNHPPNYCLHQKFGERLATRFWDSRNGLNNRCFRQRRQIRSLRVTWPITM